MLNDMLILKIYRGWVFLAALLLLSCDDDEPDTVSPTWALRGLGGQSVNEIKLSGQTLFAATDNGMYRQAVDAVDTVWDTAGLVGLEITDFVVLSNEELLASVVIGPDNPAATFYRSEDDGDTWTPVNSNFGGDVGSITCQALAVSPSSADVLYGRGNYNVAKSTDRGQTWTSVFSNWDNIGYQADLMYVYPSDADQVWAGGETSIFSPYLIKSTDAGQTWMPSDVPADGDNAVYSLVVHPTDEQRVLAGMEGQIIYSEDGGSQWEVIYLSDIDVYSYFFDLQLSSGQDERVYAVGSDGGTSLGDVLLYVSDNFGQQWEMLRYEGPSGLQYTAQDMAVTMVDGEETILIGTNHGVIRYVP